MMYYVQYHNAKLKNIKKYFVLGLVYDALL